MPRSTDPTPPTLGSSARRGRRVARLMGWTMLAGAAAGVGGLTALAVSYQNVCATPCVDLDRLRHYQPAQASIVYARDGQEIGRFFVENRRVHRLRGIPRSVQQAFLAVEDRRFFAHDGIDWARVGGALGRNIVTRRFSQGFSTITMQLARNVYPDVLPRDKALWRKLTEVRVAREIEQQFSKQQILEMYLNQIYLGHGAYGVDAAAHAYFNKALDALTIGEVALLAGLPKAPSAYDPTRHPARARARRDLVLRLLADAGVISAGDAAAAQREPIRLASDTVHAQRVARGVAPYFLEAVRQEMGRVLGDQLYRGGYRIHTTLDLALQSVAERALETQARAIEAGTFGPYTAPARDTTAPAPTETRPPYLQGAVFMMDPDSGDVRVLVGGRDYAASRFDRTQHAMRQPGSAFKPFVYATALAAGYTPESMLDDGPVEWTVSPGTIWTPENFDRTDSVRSLTLARALALSRNRATVRLAQAVGMPAIVATAAAAGLGSLPPHPAVSLGAAEVRMQDLVSAYTVFARPDGQRAVPRLVTHVFDAAGVVRRQYPAQLRPAMAPMIAVTTRRLLEGVVTYGTGAAVRQLGVTGPAFGKTGTTNGGADLWFLGGTPSLVGGVWLGFDAPRTILRGRAGTGGTLAAPVWAAVTLAAGDTVTTWRAVPDSLRPPADSSPDTSHLGRDSATAPPSALCLRAPGDEDAPAVSYFVPCPVTDSAARHAVRTDTARLDTARATPPSGPVRRTPRPPAPHDTVGTPRPMDAIAPAPTRRVLP